MKDHPSPNFLTCPLPEPVASKVQPPTPAEPPKEPKNVSTPKRHAGRRYLKWVIPVVLTLLAMLIVPPALSLARAYGYARDAKVAIQRAKADGEALQFAAVQTDLVQAKAALDGLHASLQSLGLWRDVPGIGTQIRGIEDASSAGSQTIDGTIDLATVFETITDAFRSGASASVSTGVAPTRSFQDLTPQEKRDTIQSLAAALPQMRIARDKIDLALELWNRVPQNSLYAPIRTALQPMADSLPVLKQALDQAVPLMQVGVPLAGYPDPVHALVILQNADEMRPSGGFMGTIGTLETKDGDLAKFDFADVYSVDKLVEGQWREVPPQPLAERIGASAWYLRDANWSPDFPTSAERTLDFYTRELALAKYPLTNPPNTVIAFEPGFFSALLSLTGPITVDGKTFTSENFYQQLEYQVEIGFAKQGIAVENRKQLVEDLGAALIARLRAIPSSRWPEVLNVITQSLNRKQILLYSRDQAMLSAFDSQGWSGRAKGTNGDFVWVVDANLGALKTDGVMKKRIAYHLDAKDTSHPTATVTLTYTNTNRSIDWQHTRYRSYTRVYVSEGSTLVSSSGAMKDDKYRTGGVAVPGTVDVTRELGKTVFGAFWSIEPGQTGTLSFTYTLPASVVADGSYHLDWPKQPGADRTELTLDLLFGKNILSASPAEEESKWGDQRYQVTTDTLEDRKFDITF